MIVNTVKENMCINKLIETKKEMIQIEGDMIVPDSKPDILNTICTSGIVCINRKEVLDEKVKLEGAINTYIMYIADDSNDKVRGLSTSLDFIENVNVPNCRENMICKLNTSLRSIDAKVINGRKVGIKATLEVEINIYENEDIEIINDIQDDNTIQVMKRDLKINSLLGTGDTKIYAKETVGISNEDNLAEILKANVCICNKDIKISYNKILTKAEAEIKIIYLTEDNKINSVKARIPVVGFIDMANISEENIIDVNYEIKNIIIKPNPSDEHSIYVELEIFVTASAYEEKQINLIQDLYSPNYNLEFSKRKITTITNKDNKNDLKQIRDILTLEGLEGRSIIDVDINPVIKNTSNNNGLCEGELEIRFIISDNELHVETKEQKIPFDFRVDNIENNMNNNINIEISDKDFVIQDNNSINSNIDLNIKTDSYKSSDMNIIDQIENVGLKSDQDYSVLIYIVKKGDTLWEIAKRFNTTVDEIVRVNGIEDPDIINPMQKLFIPHYQKVLINE